MAHSKSGATAKTHPSSPSWHGPVGRDHQWANRVTLGVAAVAVLALIAVVACGGGDASEQAGSSGDFALGGSDAPVDDKSLQSGATSDGHSVVTSDGPEGGNSANLASLNRLGDEPYRPDMKDTSGFINAEPFTLNDLDGQVILIDFWT